MSLSRAMAVRKLSRRYLMIYECTPDIWKHGEAAEPPCDRFGMRECASDSSYLADDLVGDDGLRRLNHVGDTRKR